MTNPGILNFFKHVAQ